MHLEPPILYYAPYQNVQRGVVPQGSFLLMLRNCSGKISAVLAKIDGTASIIYNFLNRMGFQILIKDGFRMGKQVLSILVVKMV